VPLAEKSFGTVLIDRLPEANLTGAFWPVGSRPFMAALAISKTRGGLPAPGFFDCAGRLGRFADGQDARTFHAAELNAVFARWGGSRNN
jgi:hypothetical protein